MNKQHIIFFKQGQRGQNTELPEMLRCNEPEMPDAKLPYFKQGPDFFGYYLGFMLEKDAEEFRETVGKLQDVERNISACGSIWTCVEEIAPKTFRVVSIIGAHTGTMLWNMHKSMMNGGVKGQNGGIVYPCVVSATPIEANRIYNTAKIC